MKTVYAALLALMLVACGKAELEVHTDQTPVKTGASQCMIVTILKIEAEPSGPHTFFEVEEEGIHARISRPGNWGSVGDKFKYCE